MISLDTEDTGLDFWHGSRPYLVTSCDSSRVDSRGNLVPVFWEWDVDPETRAVDVPEEDLQEVDELVGRADVLVGQNVKFDVHALATVWPPFRDGAWRWNATRDTLVAGHLLSSNTPHDLTSLAFRWLGVNVQPFEDRLKEATQAARRWCRSHLPSWAIAKKGRPDMPSAGDETWKVDAWVPRALRTLEHHGPPEWDVVLSDYANSDSAVTLRLWEAMEAELRRQDLWEIFEAEMRLVPALWEMEERGATTCVTDHDLIRGEYRAASDRAGAEMVALARRRMYDLRLPKSGNNKSLTWFVFEELGLPVVARTETGNPSISSDVAIPAWLASLPEKSDGRRFVELLAEKRDKDKSLEAMAAWERFRVPVAGLPGWATIHSSVNQTGTDTLRTSSSNPNSQNVRKNPDGDGLLLRSVFGPVPGREWWALDYENIELRIPAFVSGEQDLIDLFERKDEPPFYGSEHLLNFSVVYPDLWAEAVEAAGIEGAAEHVKERMTPWYKKCKNGDFAVGYNAVLKDHGWGTADRAFGRQHSHLKLVQRFAKKNALNRRITAEGMRRGFVETIPDRSVNPRRGYPIRLTGDERGRTSPTVPFNYWCQSTACQAARRALSRCRDRLLEWRADGFDAWAVFYVHDEFVFDFPAGGRRHLPRVRALQKLMEESGDHVGVPLSVSVKWHPANWGKSEELPCPVRVEAERRPPASRGR